MARLWSPHLPRVSHSYVLNTKKLRAFLSGHLMFFMGDLVSGLAFPVRRAIDIVSLAFSPPPSGYERDEVRAYRNRLIIDFSSNGLIQDALTRL